MIAATDVTGMPVKKDDHVVITFRNHATPFRAVVTRTSREAVTYALLLAHPARFDLGRGVGKVRVCRGDAVRSVPQGRRQRRRDPTWRSGRYATVDEWAELIEWRFA